MSSVLVGMFDSQAVAEQARSRLLSAGFAESEVALTGGSSSSDTTSSGSSSGTGGVEEPHHEGAIARFFHHLFGDDRADDAGDADTYREAFRRGSSSVTVTTSNEEMERAERILNECGAVDIDEKAESWRQEGWSGGAARAMTGDRDLESRAASASASSPDSLAGASSPDSLAGASSRDSVAGREGGSMRATSETGGTLGAGETRKLQEVEERLSVGKRAVARGGVRVFSRVVETPVEESVTLREEHASVQRRKVDREASEADLANFKEGTLEVREMAEEPVVAKTARVVGEVEIGKSATEREETVRDTVRRTQVDVEPIEGGDSGATTGDGTTGRRETAYAEGRDRSGIAEHPVGTGIGVAGGMAAGAAIGSAVGPAGTAAGAAIGAAAGAIAGGVAGEKVAEETNPKPGDDDRDSDRDTTRISRR